MASASSPQRIDRQLWASRDAAPAMRPFTPRWARMSLRGPKQSSDILCQVARGAIRGARAAPRDCDCAGKGRFAADMASPRTSQSLILRS